MDNGMRTDPRIAQNVKSRAKTKVKPWETVRVEIYPTKMIPTRDYLFVPHRFLGHEGFSAEVQKVNPFGNKFCINITNGGSKSKWLFRDRKIGRLMLRETF